MNVSQPVAAGLIILLLCSLGYSLMLMWKRQQSVPHDKRTAPRLVLQIMSMTCFAMAAVVALITATVLV